MCDSAGWRYARTGKLDIRGFGHPAAIVQTGRRSDEKIKVSFVQFTHTKRIGSVSLNWSDIFLDRELSYFQEEHSPILEAKRSTEPAKASMETTLKSSTFANKEIAVLESSDGFELEDMKKVSTTSLRITLNIQEPEGYRDQLKPDANTSNQPTRNTDAFEGDLEAQKVPDSQLEASYLNFNLGRPFPWCGSGCFGATRSCIWFSTC
ncbi:uncharacterized protein RAG0_15168 [Rhynchosporium agropyri]|uniref:Uncharacterized protein n=1 Tax=Rhynchosporium agropyri TaxID=914238 RepID=A0A1E1LJZ7_9HELO|nr:uncharacterized protein RAG0_15168 [Rhynchosporium agropyri]